MHSASCRTPEDTRYLAEFGVVFLMFSIGLEFSLARLRTMRRLVLGLGGAQVTLTIVFTMVAGWLVGRYFGVGLAGALRARRCARDVVDRHRDEDAGRARAGRHRARQAHRRRAAVPGPRGGAAARHRSGARAATAGNLAWTLAIALAKAAALLTVLLVGGQARHAVVVPHGRQAQVARAVHAERAAGDARAGVADGGGRTVARARRVRRRHADLGDRVPPPGRGGHQAVPGRPAGAVLRHDRHAAQRPRRGRPLRLGPARAGRPGGVQVRGDPRPGPALRRDAGHRDPNRPGAGDGGRVRLRAARAGRDARLARVHWCCRSCSRRCCCRCSRRRCWCSTATGSRCGCRRANGCTSRSRSRESRRARSPSRSTW